MEPRQQRRVAGTRCRQGMIVGAGGVPAPFAQQTSQSAGESLAHPLELSRLQLIDHEDDHQGRPRLGSVRGRIRRGRDQGQ